MNLVRALWRRLLGIRREWAAARARRELHALSDHMLKDIGLNRDEVDTLLR
jgi:uncharacterized protein YjiS (DUF1127 family)